MGKLLRAYRQLKEKSSTERSCIRCGCTDSYACKGGCSWLSDDVDICDACLTVDELQVVMALQRSCDIAAAPWQKFFRSAQSAFFRTLKGGRS